MRVTTDAATSGARRLIRAPRSSSCIGRLSSASISSTPPTATGRTLPNPSSRRPCIPTPRALSSAPRAGRPTEQAPLGPGRPPRASAPRTGRKPEALEARAHRPLSASRSGPPGTLRRLGGRARRGPARRQDPQVGLSNVSLKQLEAARRIAPIASVQNQYNLENRKSEDVLKACERLGVAFIPWYPSATEPRSGRAA